MNSNTYWFFIVNRTTLENLTHEHMVDMQDGEFIIFWLETIFQGKIPAPPIKTQSLSEKFKLFISTLLNLKSRRLHK